MTTVSVLNFAHEPYIPPSNREADCLSAYLGMTTWGVEEAMCILCRIDPERSKLTWSNEEKSRLLSIQECQPFDRDTPIKASSEEVSGIESDDTKFVKEVEVKIRMYRRLWNSGMQRRKMNPPIDYIRWAQENQIHIEWLEWASTTGRFKGMKRLKEQNNQFKLADEEELRGREGAAALQLIGALIITGHGMNISAKPLKGFNDLCSDLNGVPGYSISEKTLRKWIKDAAEELEKIT